MPPTRKRTRSSSPTPTPTPDLPASPLQAARARQLAQSEALAAAAHCRVGDHVEFEWRVRDTLDDDDSPNWTMWKGIVESTGPITVRWNDDCPELETPVSAWPVKPILTDPTFVFEARGAKFVTPRIRPRLQLAPVEATTPTPTLVATAPVATPQEHTAPIVPIRSFDLTREPEGTQAAPPDVFDNIALALRGERERSTIAPGLKIPRTMDDKWLWCYPHMFGGGGDGYAWERALLDFQLSAGLGGSRDTCVLTTIVAKRRIIKVWLQKDMSLDTKEELYPVFVAVAELIGAFASIANNRPSNQSVVADFEEAFSKGFVDFAALYAKATQHSKNGGGQGGNHKRGFRANNRYNKQGKNTNNNSPINNGPTAQPQPKKKEP